MLLSIKEAHARLVARGVETSKRSIYRFIKQGTLQGKWIGGKLYIPEDSIEQLLG